MESQSTATENLLQYEPRKTSSTWILQHIMLANLKYTNKPGFGQIAVMNYEERQHDWWLQEITKEAPHEAATILHPWQDVFRLAVMYVHAQAFVTWLNAIYLQKTGHSTCKLQIYAHVLRDEISRFAILTRQGLISLVCHCGLQGFCLVTLYWVSLEAQGFPPFRGPGQWWELRRFRDNRSIIPRRHSHQKTKQFFLYLVTTGVRLTVPTRV